jgi:hypothetical protein
LDEALAQEMLTHFTSNRHGESDYSDEWYEIRPGNRIIVEVLGDEANNDGRFVFVIPEAGLPDPPVGTYDDRVGPRFLDYLREHCELVEDEGEQRKEDSHAR